MYTNNFEQLRSFFIFILLGIVISIIFDVFRILRKAIKTSDMATYIEDIFFWIISGILILYTIFIFNNGVLRLYIFIGMFLGILLYMLSISKYMIHCGTAVVLFIIHFSKSVIQIFCMPIQCGLHLLKRVLLKPVLFLFINIRKFMTKNINYFKKIRLFRKKNVKKEGFSQEL